MDYFQRDFSGISFLRTALSIAWCSLFAICWCTAAHAAADAGPSDAADAGASPDVADAAPSDAMSTADPQPAEARPLTNVTAGDNDKDREDEEAASALPARLPTLPAQPRVVSLAVEGNRRVEDAAVLTTVQTRVGRALRRETLATDVRMIWALGYFDDVQVRAHSKGSGIALTYVVREKPSVRRIVIAGLDEVDLDKINEVLDLKKEQILNVAQIARNIQKIKDVYTEKGFFLADVSYRLKRVAPGRVDIMIAVEENAKVSIRRITLVGNKHIPEAKIKKYLGTQEGGYLSFLTSSGTFQRTTFDQDLLRISALYYDHGYINVKIAEPQVVLSPDKKYIYITIHVDEGQRYQIGKITIKGDLLWPKKELRAGLETREGQVFNRSRLGKDILSLVNRYKNKGYAYANVTPLTDIDATKRIVGLVFDIQKGAQVRFQRINIRGNTKTRDKVIRRELKIAEGDLFNQTLIDRSKARATALGYFESVNISTTRGDSDEKIIMNVEIKERPTGTFQIGAGFSSVESFIAQAQISQNNLFGRGQRLALQAQLSGLRQLFSLSFSEPYFFDTRWTFGFDLFNSVRIFQSFNRNATGGSLTWGYPLTDFIRTFLTYKAEIVDVTTERRTTFFGGSGLQQDLPQGVRLANLFNDGFTSSVRLQLQWDTRNNRLFPTNGFFNSAWAEFATNILGSQNRFSRFGAFSRWYRRIWRQVVFRFNAQIGIVTSPSASGVPIFERFFTGGILDVRGFRPRSLGPRIQVPQSPDPNAALFSFNKGGNKELLFNAEIEFPIFDKVGIRGVVFSDAGMSFDDNESISLEGLRHSWGFGFRWRSPIGPLRFEWGLPFSPQPGEDAQVFEFTIGNFF